LHALHEADVAQQHIEFARTIGMDVAGFLMMSHMAPPAELARQAKTHGILRAHCLYVVDSAGALLMHEVAERFSCFSRHAQTGNAVGNARAHNLLWVSRTRLWRLSMARRERWIARRMGAGAGNAPLEVLIAVIEPHGERRTVATFSR